MTVDDFCKVVLFGFLWIVMLGLTSCSSDKTEDDSGNFTDVKQKWLAPVPKKAQLGNPVFLDGSYLLELNGIEPSGVALSWLRDELSQKSGWTETGTEKAGTVISLSIEKMHKNDEAYALDIAANSIKITGASSKGLNRGIARLLYIMNTPLIENAAGTRVKCPAIKLFDWPDFPLRGMHLQIAFKVNEQLVRKSINILAMLGYNMVVLEIGGRFESNSHPECTFKPCWTQKQLRNLVKFAKARGVMAIPAIEAIGHMGRAPQIFPILKKYKTGVTRTIGMDITHKDFYKVYFDMTDELIEIFEYPPYFHIGTDEFFDVAPILDKKSSNGVDALYADFLNKVNKYFEEKEIKTIIWHDMLLHNEQVNKGEPANGKLTYKALRNINKNIIIDYWCYGSLEEYKGLSLLKNQGFNVWATPWYAETATKQLCSQAWKLKANAILGSTWHGEFLWTDSFVTTAEYSWNASKADTEFIKYAPWIITNLLFYSRPEGLIKKKTANFSFSSNITPPKWVKHTFQKKEINSSGILFEIKNPCYLGTKTKPVLISDSTKIANKDGKLKLMIINPRNSMDGIEVNALNRDRKHKELIIYTPEMGKNTQQNIYGYELVVRDNKVVEIIKEEEGCEIPQDGYVISVHLVGFHKDRWLRGNLQLGDKVKLLKFNPVTKAASAHARLPLNKKRINNLAVFFTRLYPSTKTKKLAEFTVLMSDNSREKFTLKGDVFNWKYPSSNGKWTLWIAEQNINAPEKRTIALEWKQDKTKAQPVAISVDVFPAGRQCGLTILGGCTW
jgi:glycosyl hydrolase family 20